MAVMWQLTAETWGQHKSIHSMSSSSTHLNICSCCLKKYIAKLNGTILDVIISYLSVAQGRTVEVSGLVQRGPGNEATTEREPQNVHFPVL